jgi:hypothetical protein
MSLLFASMLRQMFPPVTERPQTARIPAFWQKLELLPLPSGPANALLTCAIVLAIILYLLIMRA